MSAIVEELKRAAAGVMYPSEEDAPFTAFEWAVTAKDAKGAVAAAGKVPAGAKVEVVGAEAFFGELEGEELEGLREVLEGRLKEVGVVRVGEVRVKVYVVGRTAGGTWAGVETASMET